MNGWLALGSYSGPEVRIWEVSRDFLQRRFLTASEALEASGLFRIADDPPELCRVRTPLLADQTMRIWHYPTLVVLGRLYLVINYG